MRKLVAETVLAFVDPEEGLEWDEEVGLGDPEPDGIL